MKKETPLAGRRAADAITGGVIARAYSTDVRRSRSRRRRSLWSGWAGGDSRRHLEHRLLRNFARSLRRTYSLNYRGAVPPRETLTMSPDILSVMFPVAQPTRCYRSSTAANRVRVKAQLFQNSMPDRSWMKSIVMESRAAGSYSATTNRAMLSPIDSSSDVAS